MAPAAAHLSLGRAFASTVVPVQVAVLQSTAAATAITEAHQTTRRVKCMTKRKLASQRKKKAGQIVVDRKIIGCNDGLTT